eukprot:CAMPEP_0197004466 /NCGR_PEP_ID=MMETSP1380-20130617/23050_1 /TAXON_ID=5936 /ORGANISM="Euplotes crassus, Strain CT5" /LENGTH=179 /DNA_ID=CAMNT_0042423257 /DNA_START=358 /DNA_END=898 /DNA_ORIENTATION=-
MSWKGKNAQIKGTKRITFTDEIKKEKKKIPGPNKYKNLDKLRKRIPNGKFDQTKGVNFLSECEFLSKSQPGPTKYENQKVKVLSGTLPGSGVILNKLKHWKPKKGKGPDPGTYNHHESVKKCSSMKKITYSLPFSGNKGSYLTTRDKKKAGFKDKAYYLQKPIMDKKFVPGVGQYKFEP